MLRRKKPMLNPTRTHHRWRTRVALCAATGMVLFAVGTALWAAPAPQQRISQPTVRSLSGRIIDSGHEPIRNAVVELRNSNSGEVITFITDASGHYDFKRLNGNTDYEVWVLFRGKRSVTHTISKFDSHMTKVINFTVRTF
jgi:hypothetical protein